MKKAILFLSFLISIFLPNLSKGAFDPPPFLADQDLSYQTYYDYEVKGLAEGQFSSFLNITVDDLNKWDIVLKDFFDRNKVPNLQKLHFYSYIYLAQMDAAFLSHRATGKFAGSLDPLVTRLLRCFFPQFSDWPPMQSDAYSEMLAEIVSAPYLDRFEEEMNCQRTFSPCNHEKIVKSIAEAAKYFLWCGAMVDVQDPPSLNNKEFWRGQLMELKTIQRNASDKQIQESLRWAGKGAHPYNWHKIILNYLDDCRISLGKQLFVKAAVLMGAHDSEITVLNAKYYFCVPRPAKLDPKIQYLFTPPPSPSYPSGHAAHGACLATLLTAFFPQEAFFWNKLGKDQGESRLWAGIHYPIDADEGYYIGDMVAKKVLRRLNP